MIYGTCNYDRQTVDEVHIEMTILERGSLAPIIPINRVI